MKIRKGFVTNSSSCSYTCEVCYETESGWDINFIDYGLFECENEHIFHEGCCYPLFEKENFIKFLNEEISAIKETERYSEDEKKKKISELVGFRKIYENENIEDIEEVKDIIIEAYDFAYTLPEIFCPICNFKVLLEKDYLSYLLKIVNKTKEDIEKEITSKFDNRNDFNKFIRS